MKSLSPLSIRREPPDMTQHAAWAAKALEPSTVFLVPICGLWSGTCPGPP